MESSVVEKDQPVEIKPKMLLTGTVTKLGLAGALIEIGASQPAVLHISQINSNSEEPVKRVEDVLHVGQEVNVYVRRVKNDHIELTMFKPLDLEWREIKKGMAVHGKVTRLEKFGAFVEIGAERPGLVHISEMAHGYVRTPSDIVKEGDEVEAEVLDINRRKKQIKLSMKALQPEPQPAEEPVKVSASSQPAQEHTTKEKLHRRKKAPRKSNTSMNNVIFDFELDEPQQMETEPTVMEIALRQAMEKAKSRKAQQEKGRKGKNVSQEQEDILSRTLEQKAKAS